MKRSGPMEFLRRLHRDEGGAQMVEYVLIACAIAVPLLGVLIWFRKDLSEWVSGQYDEVKNDPNTTYDSSSQP